MPDYPLLFTFRDAVSGNGFLAGVTVHGWSLMVKENDEKWWAYGVRPAGLAASGGTPQEAHNNFRTNYTLVLYDMATDAEDFDAFKRAVEGFYSQPDHDEQNRWMAAFEAIRSGKVKIEPPFDQLPKEMPEKRPTGVVIVPLHEVQRFTPTDNVPDLVQFAAAA